MTRKMLLLSPLVPWDDTKMRGRVDKEERERDKEKKGCQVVTKG